MTDLFVRYAHPPNALGYCGPPGCRDPRAYTGAWPYLSLIASSAGIADPLDRRVVEAYWVGNGLLAAARLDRPFPALRAVLGPGPVPAGAVAHHSFHVLCGYPWAAMLPDPRRAGHALTVLDRCLIRWGRVTAAAGDQVTVRARPLTWDGNRLGLGRPVSATATAGGLTLLAGDRVSLHWDHVCDRLSDRQVRVLHRYTRLHLDLVNDRLGSGARTEMSGADRRGAGRSLADGGRNAADGGRSPADGQLWPVNTGAGAMSKRDAR